MTSKPVNICCEFRLLYDFLMFYIGILFRILFFYDFCHQNWLTWSGSWSWVHSFLGWLRCSSNAHTTSRTAARWSRVGRRRVQVVGWALKKERGCWGWVNFLQLYPGNIPMALFLYDMILSQIRIFRALPHCSICLEFANFGIPWFPWRSWIGYDTKRSFLSLLKYFQKQFLEIFPEKLKRMYK